MNQESREKPEMTHQAEADEELPFGARLVGEIMRVSVAGCRPDYATLQKLKSSYRDECSDFLNKLYGRMTYRQRQVLRSAVSLEDMVELIRFATVPPPRQSWLFSLMFGVAMGL